MTGMRSHTDHESRLDWWRRQIQRQPKTKLTVANFCRQLGSDRFVAGSLMAESARKVVLLRGCARPAHPSMTVFTGRTQCNSGFLYQTNATCGRSGPHLNIVFGLCFTVTLGNSLTISGSTNCGGLTGGLAFGSNAS